MPILLHMVTLIRGLLPIDICADLLDWFGKPDIPATSLVPSPPPPSPRAWHHTPPPGILDTMDHFKGRK